MDSYGKIVQLISQSMLNLAEQAVFLESLRSLSQAQIKRLLELFQIAPEWIEKISVNLKLKQAAAALNDSALWRRILEEEEKSLEELTTANER